MAGGFVAACETVLSGLAPDETVCFADAVRHGRIVEDVTLTAETRTRAREVRAVRAEAV